MRSLYLLRHGVTLANARRLYCGWTDIPLNASGRAHAAGMADRRPLPVCELYTTSGMKRTDETLRLLAWRAPDVVLPDLREMNFGAFEMLNYEALMDREDYRRWASDATGEIACPGGESRNAFHERILRGASTLLGLEWTSALIVTHGGVIADLMAEWFPGTERNFYEWQPKACKGYRVAFDGVAPMGFEEI